MCSKLSDSPQLRSELSGVIPFTMSQDLSDQLSPLGFSRSALNQPTAAISDGNKLYNTLMYLLDTIFLLYVQYFNKIQFSLVQCKTRVFKVFHFLLIIIPCSKNEYFDNLSNKLSICKLNYTSLHLNSKNGYHKLLEYISAQSNIILYKSIINLS